MNKTGVIVIVLVLVLLGGYFAFRGQGFTLGQNQALQNTSVQSPTSSASPSANTTNEKNTVKYTNNGFTPDTLTVKVGTPVTFVNDSANPMWVASNPHPTHTDLPGFDELQSVDKGGSYTYTFQKAGSWKYHNHLNATEGGVVFVTE